LPIALQRAAASPITLPKISYQAPVAGSEVLDQCVELFRKERFAIWLGFGARESADELRELVELTGAPVLATPRAKGIFPEDHPLYLGVTGMGGHERVYESLDISAVDRILVLGTRMGEGSSFWSPRLVPDKGFVHVDVDPVVFGLAYPEAPTLGVQSEIKAFLRGLLARRDQLSFRPVERRTPSMRVALGPRPGRVRTAYLMQEMQRVVVNGSDALVMTESGNAFVWGNGSLSFRTPGRYRVSVGYGSMGHFTVGAFGAALATSRRAFAVVGDGAMLMNNEINTAVQYGARAVWVILNDGRYGMVEQGMRATGYAPLDVSFPEVDFVAVAKGMGANGVHVRDESEIGAALSQALEADGPFVIDVATDPSERSPVIARVKSLVNQGG
jgi:acetolactate synthase-1/2/3 large subunit